MLVEKLITRRWRTLVPLVAACLLATACSSIRFGYDTMPLWLGWRIDRHLALDPDQRELVTSRLDALHRWHRQTQLPAYAGFLNGLQGRLDRPVAPEEVGEWRERMLAAWIPIAERAAPEVAALALTLRPAQLERLARRLQESNDDLRREMLADEPGQRAAARAERVVKRARFFVGDLSAGEEAELRQRAAALPAVEAEWLAEREARQRAVLDLLARIVSERPPLETAERWCRELLTGLWQVADPARRDALARSTAAGDALSASILAGRLQRERLLARLRGFAEDFSVLAAR